MTFIILCCWAVILSLLDRMGGLLLTHQNFLFILSRIFILHRMLWNILIIRKTFLIRYLFFRLNLLRKMLFFVKLVRNILFNRSILIINFVSIHLSDLENDFLLYRLILVFFFFIQCSVLIDNLSSNCIWSILVKIGSL